MSGRYDYALRDIEPGKVAFLKLHGSLNWFREKTEARAVVPYQLSDFMQTYTYGPYRDGEPPLAKAEISKIAAERIFAATLRPVYSEPVLVPPTWSKGEYHRELQNVWRQAARELEEASYIFVIGYSLPETDQFFRLLFALGTEGLSVLNKIEIFDPNPDPVDTRFRQMLGSSALARYVPNRADFRGALQVIDQYMFMNGRRP